MVAFQVTLTSSATNYNLLTLVRAVDSTFVDGGDVLVQVNDDSGAQVVLLGDATLDATHYGALMRAGDWSPRYSSVGGLYARCDLSGKKLNISINR